MKKARFSNRAGEREMDVGGVANLLRNAKASLEGFQPPTTESLDARAKIVKRVFQIFIDNRGARV